LPEPGLVEWVKLCVHYHKFPAQRRRLKWRSQWQFARVVTELGPGDVAIDCGASDGRCTGMLAARGATVYSFEPDPHGFAALENMFKGHPNIHLRQQAVGTSAGRLTLYRAGNFSLDPDKYVQATSAFASKRDVDPGNAIEVDQIDFPAFVASLGAPIALLKIDIEGAEVPILESLLDTGVISRIRYTFAETHERTVPELADRIRALRERVAREGLRNVNLDWI
jgi:FkbM family methyltransferase